MFKLIGERRLTKDELDGYKHMKEFYARGFSKRQMLQLVAGGAILSAFPIIRVSVGAPMKWTVTNVHVRQPRIPMGSHIPARITVNNPSPQQIRAKVRSEYFLPSGLSGAQAAKTLSIPPNYEQEYDHDGFIARELGESIYEAMADLDEGEGDESDNFDVIGKL